MKKVIAVLMIILLAATPVFASPRGHHPRPQPQRQHSRPHPRPQHHHHHHHSSSDDSSIGTAAGIVAGLAVLGALLGAADNNSQNNEERIKVQKTLIDHATGYAEDFVAAASQVGAQRAMEATRRMFMDNNVSAEINNNDVLTARMDGGEEVDFELDSTGRYITVTARVPDMDLAEKVRREIHMSSESVLLSNDTQFSMLESAGFDVSDKAKSREGYLIIESVRPGSAMANLGAMAGTELYMVNNINTKNCSAQELRDHIRQCAKDHMGITVVFMDPDGKQKNIDINLR